MSLHPNRGGVGKDIEQLTNRSLIDLVNVEIDLDLRHLNGDIKKKIQKIEADKKDGFATNQSKVGDYKNFVYNLPITLKKPIIAPKRLFDKSIVDEVTPPMKELIREGVVVEATDNIAIVSNLLPISKPTANYA